MVGVVLMVVGNASSRGSWSRSGSGIIMSFSEEGSGFHVGPLSVFINRGIP